MKSLEKHSFDAIQKNVVSPIPAENAEEMKVISDKIETGSFYRGLSVEDAFKGIGGKLFLESDPKGDVIGSRDNVSLKLQEAIYLAAPSVTKDGKKFLCAVGFDPLPGVQIEDSFLNKGTFRRLSGPVKVTEIVLRFAGRESGKPGKIKHLSPRDFYHWYHENIAEN